MPAVFATVLSLASAVVVAFLAHWLADRRTRGSELATMRLKAYGDFLQAASRLVAARRLGRKNDELEELAALNDAKARICVCAEATVVEALAEFWLAGGTLEREQEILAFKRLCVAMRESLGNRRNDIAMLRLSDTLFRLEPSVFSFRADRMGNAATD
ncbi:hypothetical protein [Billgrantia sp. C5P2]|uniref:hypothetical protein n=1 Tax=Billgrantia sp. C5P2 TaxID=3436239 RepID=UPI003DA5D433